MFIQTSTDGKMKIISCGFTGLTDAQTRYSICNLEMAAMVFACTKLTTGQTDNWTTGLLPQLANHTT